MLFSRPAGGGSGPASESVFGLDGCTGPRRIHRVNQPAYHAVQGWSVEELSSVPYWELLHPNDKDRSVELSSGCCSVDPGACSTIRSDAVPGRRLSMCSVGHPVEPRKAAHIPRRHGHHRSRTDRHRQTCPGRLLGLAHPHQHRDLVTQYVRDLRDSTRGDLQPGDRPATLVRQRSRGCRTGHPARLTTAEPYTADHRIAHSNGDIRWLHSAGRVFRGENGDPQRMRGLTWDVTERPGNRVPG
jgi:PAS domain-containing protein